MTEKATGRAILHIGRHKTGTSSLQHFLVHNEHVLRNCGILYPLAMRKGPAHHRLAAYLEPRIRRRFTPEELDGIERDYEGLQREMDGAERVLISSEAFQGVAPEKLFEVFGRDATVIVYIREQFDYLLSSYAQAIQNQKLTLTLDEYASTMFNANYNRFLGQWQTTFGRDRLIVRIFERSQLDGADIRLDFLRLIGVAEHSGRFDLAIDEQNTSIGGALLEFKRRLNARPFESLIAPAPLYKVLEAVARGDRRFSRSWVFDPALAERVRHKYEPSNRAVCRRFFPHRTQLFDLKMLESAPPPTAAEFDEVAKAINAVEPNLGDRLFDLLRRG